MIAFIAAVVLQIMAPAPPPPETWSSLPDVPLTQASGLRFEDTNPVTQFAERRRECHAGIGPMPSPRQHPTWRMQGLAITLAVLIAPDGRILNVLAAPGACDAIRNYARALVNERYRGRIGSHEGEQPRWYVTRLTFTWDR